VDPTSSSLGSRQRLFRPSCAGPSSERLRARPTEATHIARTARARACLRREQRSDPRHLPSARSHSLATAVEDYAQTIRVRVVSRHPFACCDGTRRRPRWWISAPRYPALPERLAAPALETGKMLLTDFCNRRATRAPDGSFDSRGGRLACALLATSDGAKAPADDPGRYAFDDASRASVGTVHATADAAVADATRSCRAPDRNRAHKRHPPAAALSSAGGPNVTTSDALVATRVRRSAARAARIAFPAASSKATAPNDPGRLPSTSARSTNPACAEMASNADPPPIPRLCHPGPASDALSPRAPEGEGARPCRFRAFITPGRTWPRAARRLLQSKVIRKHDLRTFDTSLSSRAARLSPKLPISWSKSRSGNWTNRD
jgi:hypothetical protein